jgi:plastocyanin
MQVVPPPEMMMTTMTKRLTCSFALGLLTLTLSCSESATGVSREHVLTDVTAATAVGLPSNAVVTFGRTGVGSPFPAPISHDNSIHSYDKILPQTVNILAGGSVTFEILPIHAVAIYDDGTKPSDITLSPATLDDLVLGPVTLPDFVINDPANRIAQGPAPLFAGSWTTPAGTFDDPGTYLVICTIRPHFVEAKMYAYVKVH